MLLRPHYLFKFKGVTSETDIERIIDILHNKRIFLPNPTQLNDPFEGLSVKANFGYAGSGYRAALGYPDVFYRDVLSRFKVLSLSSIINSPIMWAHYGMEYKGCCLIISTKNIFEHLYPVIYTDIIFNIHDEKSPLNNMDMIIKDALTIKKSDWAYENEWRYIDKTSDQYLQLEPEDIVGVIIGQNMDEEKKKVISEVCKKEKVYCLKTRIMSSKCNLMFVPYDFTDDDIFKGEEKFSDDTDLDTLIKVLNGYEFPKGFYNEYCIG